MFPEKNWVFLAGNTRNLGETGPAQTYVLLHENDASIKIIHHFPKVRMVDQTPYTRGVKTPSGRFKVGIVVKVGANFISELLQTFLLVEQVVTLGAKRGGLRLDSLEGVGQRAEHFQRAIGVIYETVEVTLGQL